MQQSNQVVCSLPPCVLGLASNDCQTAAFFEYGGSKVVATIVGSVALLLDVFTFTGVGICVFLDEIEAAGFAALFPQAQVACAGSFVFDTEARSSQGRKLLFTLSLRRRASKQAASDLFLVETTRGRGSIQHHISQAHVLQCRLGFL